MSKKIISYEAACAALGRNHEGLPDLLMFPEPQQNYLIGLIKLDAITKALNDEDQPEEWNPDYNNWDQRKYQPYFELSSGGVWLYDVYGNWRTTADAGARPFRTGELAKFAGTHFIDIYQPVLNYITNNL